MHDNDVIIVHARVYHHIATVIVDYGVANNHGVADNHRVADNYWIMDDHTVGDYDLSARNIHRVRLRGHHRSGSRRDDHLFEERFPMAEAVEVKAHEAAPLAFEDEELLHVVVAPILADFVARPLTMRNLSRSCSTLGSLNCI